MGFRFAGPIGASGRPPEIIDAGTTQPVENHAPGVTDVLKAAGRASPLVLMGPAGVAAVGLVTVGQLYYSKNLDSLSVVRDRAVALAPAAIADATGFSDLGKLLNSILYGLLAAMIALTASTALGGTIGGVVGFFFGGAGAAPGAVVGAKAGFEVGLAILTWLGVGFLAVSIIGGLGELISLELSAVRRGWAAGDLSGTRRSAEIEAAAQELAKAAGVLIRLILEGILAYLMRGAPMATTRAAGGTVNQVRTAGSEAVAAETVAELVRNLRKSNLGKGFADWVELNWQKLLANPKLRRYAPEAKAPVTAAGAGAAQTPSQARKEITQTRDEPGATTPAATVTSRDRELAKSTGNSAEIVAARNKVAADFYERNGMSNKLADELPGIDFTKPVEVVSFPPPETMSQFVRNGGKPGRFFDPIGGQSPGSLGVDGVGRSPVTFKSPVGEGLKSTAAPIVDSWTNPANPVSTPGGGTQIAVSFDTLRNFTP